MFTSTIKFIKFFRSLFHRYIRQSGHVAWLLNAIVPELCKPLGDMRHRFNLRLFRLKFHLPCNEAKCKGYDNKCPKPTAFRAYSQ